jgi:hypothetical protein
MEGQGGGEAQGVTDTPPPQKKKYIYIKPLNVYPCRRQKFRLFQQSFGGQGSQA